MDDEEVEVPSPLAKAYLASLSGGKKALTQTLQHTSPEAFAEKVWKYYKKQKKSLDDQLTFTDDEKEELEEFIKVFTALDRDAVDAKRDMESPHEPRHTPPIQTNAPTRSHKQHSGKNPLEAVLQTLNKADGVEPESKEQKLQEVGKLASKRIEDFQKLFDKTQVSPAQKSTKQKLQEVAKLNPERIQELQQLLHGEPQKIQAATPQIDEDTKAANKFHQLLMLFKDGVSKEEVREYDVAIQELSKIQKENPQLFTQIEKQNFNGITWESIILETEHSQEKALLDLRQSQAPKKKTSKSKRARLDRPPSHGSSSNPDPTEEQFGFGDWTDQQSQNPKEIDFGDAEGPFGFLDDDGKDIEYMTIYPTIPPKPTSAKTPHPAPGRKANAIPEAGPIEQPQHLKELREFEKTGLLDQLPESSQKTLKAMLQNKENFTELPDEAKQALEMIRNIQKIAKEAQPLSAKQHTSEKRAQEKAQNQKSQDPRNMTMG